MKKVLSFGFLLMGFTFTVTQGLLIRELLVAFFGNELSIGLILGNWLILEALGSGLLGKLADKWGDKPSSFAVLQILFALFLPLCLYAAYVSRSIVGAIPGEGMGLIPIFWSTFLILTPLALVDGAMFTFGCRAFASLTGRETPSIGRVYVFEALGAIAGGLIFTYLFIPFLSSLRIVLVLTGLNLISAALILVASNGFRGKRLFGKVAIFLILLLTIINFGFLISTTAERVQRWAVDKQWVGLDLIYSENSVYGNVAVVKLESQYTFYVDGIPVLTAPDPDVFMSEEIVHLPMLFIPEPKKVLVLSGGLGGVLNELAKYPLRGIDYAELDPLLIEVVQRFPTPLTLNEIRDPRLHVEYIDGRLLVNQKSLDPKQEYDLVIVNLPYPSSLQLNRYYTLEFFEMVREILSEDGVLVICSPGSLSYLSEELRDLNNTAYHTLSKVYPHVRPIPGDLTLWLASTSEELTSVPLETLIERWEDRALEVRLLSVPHIRLRLGQLRQDWFWSSLGEGEGRSASLINQDLHPVGLYYGISYWHALFSPQLTGIFSRLGRLNLWALILPIAGISLIMFLIIRLTGKGDRAVIPLVIAVTGFTGMTIDIMMIFAFQSLYGYVYHWIGLFITAFMAGLSLGGLLMTRRLSTIVREKRVLLSLEGSMVIFWIIIPIILYNLYVNFTSALISGWAQGLLLILNAVGGFLVGSQFPLANKMLLDGRDKLKGSAGILYASDLVGAFVGSIVVSVVLIPVIGMIRTCLLAAILKLCSMLLTLTLTRGSRVEQS
ncbi:MAG: fused MFS/spermidine synthase [Anaerolineaceae bacterium]|nr:MAG: fused MFS/spermidine synthase [Anaerolineaceae bacterium]